MKCPLCDYEQYCPCESCKERLPEGFKPWEWFYDEFIACGNCGLYLHCDQWLDLQMEQIKD